MVEPGAGVGLHVVVASALFCCALLCDAFTALGSSKHADVPSSLRATGMVAAVLLASPVIKSHQTRASSPWQRPLISALLVFAAAAGEHHGLEYVRLADSAFVAVVAVCMIWLFSIESPTPPGALQPSRCKRRSATAASAALLLYASSRQLRSALVHSQEVLDTTVAQSGSANSTELEMMGYAHSSDTAVFGGAVGASAGLMAGYILLQHEKELSVTTARLALQLGAAALLQIFGCFACILSLGSQAETLVVVFGTGACRDTDSCGAAVAARRTSFVNHPASSLLFSALGLFALCEPARERTVGLPTAGTLVVLSTAAGLLYVCYRHCTFEGDQQEIDYFLMAAVASAAIAAVGDDVVLGNFLSAGLGWYGLVSDFSRDGGLVLSSLYNAARLVSLLALSAHCMGASMTFLRCFESGRTVSGASSAVGASAATALAVGSAVALASSDGSYAPEFAAMPQREAVRLLLERFVPIVTWLPSVASLYELGALRPMACRVLWWTSPLGVALVWLVGRSAAGAEQAAGSLVASHATVGWLLGAFAWAAAGAVVGDREVR